MEEQKVGCEEALAVAEEVPRVVSMVPLAMRHSSAPMSSQESRTHTQTATSQNPGDSTRHPRRRTQGMLPLRYHTGPSSLLPGWGSAGAEAAGSVEVAELMAAMVVTVEVEMAEGVQAASLTPRSSVPNHIQ